MRVRSAEFASSAVDRTQYPSDGLPEIALVGRSNVGKSSLINRFVNRRSLAKTSSAPGKTRTVNFYRINGSFYLVDLPGFGYARVPMSVKRSWEAMVGRYVEDRKPLKGFLVILDPRRDPGELEEMVYSWADGLGLPAETVFTKADKLSRNKLASRLAGLRKVLPVEDPVVFSASTGAGKEELGKTIEGMLRGG